MGNEHSTPEEKELYKGLLIRVEQATEVNRLGVAELKGFKLMQEKKYQAAIDCFAAALIEFKGEYVPLFDDIMQKITICTDELNKAKTIIR
jgi:hypothetical protein